MRAIDALRMVGGQATEIMRVAGAGTTANNGDYLEKGTQNGKPKYVKIGDSSRIIKFDTIQWNIGIVGANDYNSDGIPPETPDLVSTWVAVLGDEPAPTVTKI